MCFHHTAWKLPRKRRAPGRDGGHSSEMSHFRQAAGVTPEKARTGKPGRWPGCAGALTGPWDRAPDRSQETLTQALNPKDHILHKPRHRPTGSGRHRTAHALTGMDRPRPFTAPASSQKPRERLSGRANSPEPLSPSPSLHTQCPTQAQSHKHY